MRMRILGLAFVVAVGMFGAQSSAESSQAPSLSKDDAARVMRMLMTIQGNRPFGKGQYGLLEEVMKGVQLAGEDAVRVDDHTFTYRGYTIRMMRGATRQNYSLTMVPSNGFCAASYFANEMSIIYVGQAIGCPAQ
jgi:hypothetical protein